MTNRLFSLTGKNLNIFALLILSVCLGTSVFAQTGKNAAGSGALTGLPEKQESAVLARNTNAEGNSKAVDLSDEEKAIAAKKAEHSAAMALELEKKVFEILNQTRIENGLPPRRLDR